MKPNTHVPHGASAQAVVRLKVENFDQMMRVIGMDSPGAQGEAIGVHPKTVTRARQGANGIGEEFIAKTIASLRKHERLLTMCGLDPTFDKLFEVVEIEPEAVLA